MLRLASLFAVLLTVAPTALWAQTFQIDTQFITGLRSPTAMTFAPDGRLFVTEQGGAVRVVTADDQLLPTPFLTLSNVRTDGEQGLLGLAFDPAFALNGYVYVFYTTASPRNSRVSRFTANGNVVVPGSEVILFEYGNYAGNHRGGDIHFGADGKLYFATGDAGNPSQAQQVTSFNGKILRLNRDGSIPSDNPTTFRDTSGATLTPSAGYRAIWAMGLRNPFRFAMEPATGRVHVNDVGAGTWEEVNSASAGSNFGWPTCEGACSNGNATNPVYAHRGGVDGTCAITGGVFYDGGQFPATYTNNYFVIDYCTTWVRYLRTDNTWAALPVTIPSSSVGLKVAPDGSVYVLGHGSGTISRITYSGSGSNRNPVAQFSATPTSGSAPLNVAFNAIGSTDPDGDPLTFAWNFGDNTTGSGVNVSHTYAANGTYVAQLTVTDGRGGSATRQVSIAVGARPTATITSPAQGASYSAGTAISFAGQGTSASGAALPASALSWTVVFHHDTHTHPALGPVNGVASGSYTPPTSGHTESDVFYRIHLTVTDPSGLQTTVTRDVQPRTAVVTITSNVAGTQVLVDGQPRTTPFSFTGVAGVRRALDVVTPQTIGGLGYQFGSWSNGGPRNQTLVTPSSNFTLTVNMTPAVPPPAPPGNVRIIR